MGGLLFAEPAKAVCTCYDTLGSAFAQASHKDDFVTEESACYATCQTELKDLLKDPKGSGGYSVDQSAYDAAIAEAEAYAKVAQALSESAAYESDGLCSCYCGTKGRGAVVQQGRYESSNICKSICDKGNEEFSVCVFEAAQSPFYNGLCWSSGDCAASNGGEWGSEQPAECASGDHYCYPPAEAVILSTSIGGTTQVFNIGSYINLIYTYGLGTASIIAVVMMMIGGAQYIIGSGTGGEAVAAAKTRITNAVTGLALLFCIYIILYAVNPDLTVFKTIQMPRIKPSLFVQGSCQTYIDKGYKVKSSGGGTSCGYTGVVFADPNDISMSEECQYDKCTTTGQVCANLDEGYKCMSCADGNSAAVAKGLTVNAQSCSSLSPKPDTSQSSKGSEIFNFCKVVQDEALFSTDADVCALVTVDCSAIKNCWSYGHSRVNDGKYIETSEANDEAYYDLCLDNPCPQITGSCTPIDAEEYGGLLQMTVGANSFRRYFEDNPDKTISSEYVLSQDDVQMSFAEQVTGSNFSFGSSDVACAPSALIK